MARLVGESSVALVERAHNGAVHRFHPDIVAARARQAYEGDLAGAGVIAALLLVVPFARPEASWLGGLTGAVIGLLVGLGVGRLLNERG